MAHMKELFRSLLPSGFCSGDAAKAAKINYHKRRSEWNGRWRMKWKPGFHNGLWVHEAGNMVPRWNADVIGCERICF